MAKADIQAILERHPGGDRETLMQILLEVQKVQGYISREAVESICKHLKLTASEIYGLISFYKEFRFDAPGRYNIQVCQGMTCYMKKSQPVLDTFKLELGITEGQTTPDGFFSLDAVACIGICGLAPAIIVNGKFHAEMNPEKAKKMIRDCREGVDIGGLVLF
jgi:NADH-quinone oxidoreductase subunit E